MDLGTTRIRSFIRVTGLQLMPAIAASAMLIFPWSFDDFVVTYFVAGIGGLPDAQAHNAEGYHR